MRFGLSSIHLNIEIFFICSTVWCNNYCRHMSRGGVQISTLILKQLKCARNDNVLFRIRPVRKWAGHKSVTNRSMRESKVVDWFACIPLVYAAGDKSFSFGWEKIRPEIQNIARNILFEIYCQRSETPEEKEKMNGTIGSTRGERARLVAHVYPLRWILASPRL